MKLTTPLSVVDALAVCRDVLEQCGDDAPAVVAALLEGRRVCGPAVLDQGQHRRHNLDGYPIAGFWWDEAEGLWRWSVWREGADDPRDHREWPKGTALTWREAEAALVTALEGLEWVCVPTPLDREPVEERDPETLTDSEREVLEQRRQPPRIVAQPLRLATEQQAAFNASLREAAVRVEEAWPGPAGDLAQSPLLGGTITFTAGDGRTTTLPLTGGSLTIGRRQ